MEAEDNLHRENTALMLQGKFLGIALLGAVFYLAVLGVRAICTEKGPGALEETTCMRTARQAMRLAFGAATVLLVFGAAGFSPAPCCWAACGISLASSVGMLASISESPPFQELHSTFRTQLQAHCFNTVTLCCIDGLGCVLLQQFTLDERYSKWEIKVRIVGFQLAFSAAVWFAVILAARDLIKTKLSQ